MARISRHEENASLSAYAPVAAPASVGRATKAMKEEWERFVLGGVEETELRSA